MECDPTRICQILAGLPEVTVLGVDDVHGDPLMVHIESQIDARDCPWPWIVSGGARPVQNIA